jgi:hypothetical protein
LVGCLGASHESWEKVFENNPYPGSRDLIALCEKKLPYWNKERFSKPPPPFIGEPFRLYDESEPKE